MNKNLKSTKIAIIIIASVMAIAGTTLTLILQQQQQVNAASLRNPIENGIIQSVGADHRSQHSNQENLCYRDNTCRDSNVDQGTLGNDNSVTGFTDQSTTNTTSANTATSGPAGPAGAKGDPGAQGPVGPAGSPRTLVVTQRSGEEVIIPPSSGRAAEARCNAGEVITGGGYSVESEKTIILQNFRDLFNAQSWRVFAHNTDTTFSDSLIPYAECASLVP